jgi:sugar/nucleoside kinase (ribokinase family)
MITVVGSIAYDAVSTPSGTRERMLGGAATHFALAASLFDQVTVVGRVGEDFDAFDALRTRGTDTRDVERVPGRTFFWRGEYGDDLNARRTLDTQLGVFAGFAPELSEHARSCHALFLANIQPQLQRAVLDQCPGARFVALDSMDLWIETERDALLDVVADVDCVILNDAELRALTGRATVAAAARALGPRVVVVKLGEYGAALYADGDFFALPAYPLEHVVDPTGAGDTFAGGFVGCVARGADLRGALAHGVALASFNVEAFGTERVAALDPSALAPRVHDLLRFTRFDLEAA